MESCYRIKLINPSFDLLGYITAIANVQDKHDRSTPSNYHWKILKCRMIIFSNSSILACPDKTDTRQVHIVFNKMSDDYDKLNSLFIKFSLIQDGSIRKVTSEIYQMCFHYTLTAKLAPIYNVIGYNYLINNRNFLITKGRQEGLKINISCNDQITTMELQPITINLIRSDDSKPGDWVRVLPSLCKAVVEDYYENLPEDGTFKSYKDMRRHWKNIHGYRLPDEECTHYYAVRFWRGEPLTYPKICVVQNFPIISPLPKAFQKTVMTTFLSCFKQRMPYILGSPQKTEGNISVEEIVYQDKVPETQLVSLCTPTQILQPKKSNF